MPTCNRAYSKVLHRSSQQFPISSLLRTLIAAAVLAGACSFDAAASVTNIEEDPAPIDVALGVEFGGVRMNWDTLDTPDTLLINLDDAPNRGCAIGAKECVPRLTARAADAEVSATTREDIEADDSNQPETPKDRDTLPEPGTMALLGAGLVAFGVLMRSVESNEPGSKTPKDN
jgi:hypothetical protein